MARHILVDHLLVGEGAFRDRAPVDHPLPAVDVPLVVKLDENLLHRLGQSLIHREALALPVAGTAEGAELADDLAAEFALPLPYAADELLAAEFVAAGVLLFAQVLLHPRFGRDAGVVGAGEPADFLALHAVVAAQNILQRVVQHMSESQDAGDVRRRDHDRIGFLIRIWFAVEIPGLLPCREPLGFHRRRFVGARQRFVTAHRCKLHIDID